MKQSEMLKYVYDWVIKQENQQPVSAPPLDLPFEVYPHDLPKLMTYLEADKAVKELGDGWRIPTLEELRLMYKNKDKIGGFCTEDYGSDYPDWYWSSSENRVNSSHVHGVRFSDGDEYWGPKDDDRLSCRPVRLVAADVPKAPTVGR